MGANECPVLVSADWTVSWSGFHCAEHKERGEAKEEVNGFRGGVKREVERKRRRTGEHEHLQGLSRTSPKPVANDFFFFFSLSVPSFFGLLPPQQLYKATD